MTSSTDGAVTSPAGRSRDDRESAREAEPVSTGRGLTAAAADTKSSRES